jgi:hypothetical protein
VESLTVESLTKRVDDVLGVPVTSPKTTFKGTVEKVMKQKKGLPTPSNEGAVDLPESPKTSNINRFDMSAVGDELMAATVVSKQGFSSGTEATDEELGWKSSWATPVKYDMDSDSGSNWATSSTASVLSDKEAMEIEEAWASTSSGTESLHEPLPAWASSTSGTDSTNALWASTTSSDDDDNLTALIAKMDNDAPSAAWASEGENIWAASDDEEN